MRLTVVDDRATVGLGESRLLLAAGSG